MSTTDTDPPMARVGRFLRDNPMVPLLVFLFLLIASLEVMRPGIVMPVRAGRDGLLSTFWIGNLIKFAIPLAMLAACQVLTMLTALICPWALWPRSPHSYAPRLALFGALLRQS
jgi:ribose transport system permease protein